MRWIAGQLATADHSIGLGFMLFMGALLVYCLRL